MALLTNQHLTQLGNLSAAAQQAQATPPADFCSLWRTVIAPALEIAKDVAPIPISTIIGILLGAGNALCPAPAAAPASVI